MTVNAFFDESGKFRDKKVICFGGVASYEEDIKSFGLEWGRLLHLNGLTSGLHFSQAIRHWRPLSKKNQDTGLRKRIRALLPFVQCIRKYLLVVTGVAIDVDAFKSLPSHTFEIWKNDPIYMAFCQNVNADC